MQNRIKNNIGDTEDKILSEEIDTIQSIPDYVDECIYNACTQNASDIHIDPKAEHVEVYFRVAGKIIRFASYPKTSHEELVGRVKILARLRTDVHDRNQDGRMYFTYKTQETHKTKVDEVDTIDTYKAGLHREERIDIRVSILPTFFGENVVMRVLRPEMQRHKELQDLGLSSYQVSLITESIGYNQGIIVIAGPTGSGKTTTIYTILSILSKKEKNIVTLEDPIEYVIPGIRQVQISEASDFGFSKALRALLRQDPDVIVIGEIRDGDTAQLAFQASLTGHLVICTIHAEDCAGVYARLSNLGVHKDMMHSLTLMISQRLIEVDASVESPSGVPKIRRGIFEVIPVSGTIKSTLFQNSYPEYIRKALQKQGVLLLEDSLKEITKSRDKGAGGDKTISQVDTSKTEK